MTASAGRPMLAQRLDHITQTVAILAFGGLVVMALLIFYDGVARYLNSPRISGFSDYGEVVYPIVIAACFPAGLLRQSNITVRLVGTALGSRVNAWLELFAALITLAFFAILAWQLVLLTLNYADGGRTTRTIGIPLAPWWWIACTIMLTCVPVQVFVVYSWCRAIVYNEQPEITSLGTSSQQTDTSLS